MTTISVGPHFCHFFALPEEKSVAGLVAHGLQFLIQGRFQGAVHDDLGRLLVPRWVAVDVFWVVETGKSTMISR